jgi:hypothetical protein
MEVFMKKFFLFLSVAVAMTACKTDYDGRLQVVEPMPGVVNGKKVTFPVGTYPATLAFNSKTKVTLTVKAANKSYDLVMKIPNMTSAPADGTPVIWDSKITGQPFDIYGQTSTRQYQTPVKTTQMSCQYQRPETVCWGGPRPGCGTQWVTYQGWQQVEYYDDVTERTVTAEVREPGTAHPYADLSGTNDDTDRHYVSQGPCY